ncbi:MAG: helix-hairpin-helix domain-containing protein, partial [Calditrichaeota bacterium]|nr:helix-hairpin-helix domain-containing protein [Calditrichota bacterium]
MSRYLTFVFGLMLLLSVGSCPVLAQEASPYSYENQLDINNAEYEDIARLPLPADLAEKIYDRILYQGPFTSIFQLREIEGIDQPLLLKLKPLIRIEPYMERSEREERLEELYYQLDRWGGDEGSNQALIDSWIEQALSPVNINEMRLDELLNLQGVSPVDAAAIINYRNESGRIASLRDLRNAPYLSYFGYRNTRNFVSFEEAAPTREFHGTLLTRMSNTPFLTEEGDVTSASIGDLADVGANDYPDVYTRLIGSWGPDLKFGVSHWRSLGEPSLTSDIGFAKVPDLKVYLGLENRKLGPVDLRKLYLGNYTIAFGQGVVMENTDFFTPRKSGFGFR